MNEKTNQKSKNQCPVCKKELVKSKDTAKGEFWVCPDMDKESFTDEEVNHYNKSIKKYVPQIDSCRNVIHPLFTMIRDNVKLRELENEGFKYGEQKGKTMNGMTVEQMFINIRNQFRELEDAEPDDSLVEFNPSSVNGKHKYNDGLLRIIADIRNNAGLMFLLVDNHNLNKELP